jgi:hypothetical protein
MEGATQGAFTAGVLCICWCVCIGTTTEAFGYAGGTSNSMVSGVTSLLTTQAVSSATASCGDWKWLNNTALMSAGVHLCVGMQGWSAGYAVS